MSEELDEYASIEEAAIREVRKLHGRASGQLLHPSDHLEYWIWKETVRRHAEHLEQAVEAEREVCIEAAVEWHRKNAVYALEMALDPTDRYGDTDKQRADFAAKYHTAAQTGVKQAILARGEKA